MIKICMVEGCERVVKAKQKCWKHYESPTVCSVSGCSNPNDARGFCKPHYKQVRRSEGVGTLCEIDGCDKPHEAKGLCDMHYSRFLRYGTSELMGRPFGATHHNWQGDNITYDAAHRRVKSVYGDATEHLCVYCACPAQQWSYDHQDPTELTDLRGRPYSPDIRHYEPLCRKCHRHEDVRAAASRKQLQLLN